MKKIWTRVVVGTLCVAMLSGCSGGKQSSEVDKKAAKATTLETVKKVKAKYADNDTVDYEEPMYNLEKDHVFTFENLPEKYYLEQDGYDCFEVYYDSDLKKKVDIEIVEDFDNKTASIKPHFVFSCDGEGSSVIDGTWGSRSKFWLVRKVDLKTGEMLKKPVVTVFSTREDLNTPTLKQSVGEDGLYTLSWSEVEGADYYEIYQYRDYSETSAGSACLEVTTKNTSCKFDEFKSEKDYKQHYKETFEGTEIDVTEEWSMNSMLDKDDSYFVVAKTNDGKKSGLSNFCAVADVAGQIPCRISSSFKKEYEGDTALVLPAYVDVEMKDGSVGKFLIEYHGAKATHLSDGRIYLQCTMKNLPIEMYGMFLSGMEYDTFLEDVKKVTEREDQLATKSVTYDKNIDVPYLPDNDYETPANQKPQDQQEEPAEATSKPETNPQDQTENPGQATSKPETDSQDKPEDQSEEPAKATKEPKDQSDEKEESEEKDDKKDKKNNPAKDENYSNLDISEELANTVYANSAVGEWLALNMLDHQEKIYLGDFSESADTEKIYDAFLEAYNQNPLIGVINATDYDFEENAFLVDYQLSKEETKKMQDASMKKAKEIVKKIIKDGMSDYEKEEAINQYLCKNGSYNDDIMKYIKDDGTLDDEAANKYVHSFTPYGILVENVGVCESYSEAFLLLTKEAGLDSVIATGTLDGVCHEWNRINLDGQWYTMDVTNNDCDMLPNCYFNLSDEVAGSFLLQDSEAFLDSKVADYKANDMNNEYYTKNNLAANDATEAVQMLTEKVADNKNVALRVVDVLEEKEVDDIIGQVCDNMGISVRYYYRAGVISVIKD